MPDETWVVDTSSLIWVKQSLPLKECARVFRGLDPYVTAGRFALHRKVIDELKRFAGPSDPPLAFALRHQKVSASLPEFPEALEFVLKEVPRVLDPDKISGAEEADPYVLALALQIQQDGGIVTVLNEERRDRPDKMSLTTACGVLRLVSLPIATFIERQGI